MSVGNLGLYRPDGRLRGSFVYMLLCRDKEGPVYVKAGITDKPDDRLLALRLGCPVTPRQFHTMEVMSRRKARNVERDLHQAFRRWAAHGEWFRISMDDRQQFNEAWRGVLALHAVPGWPARWERVPVQPLVEMKQRASRFRLRCMARRGGAYLDVSRESRKRH